MCDNIDTLDAVARDCLEYEKALLTMFDASSSEFFLNMSNGTVESIKSDRHHLYKKWGPDNGFYGKKHTDETKAILSAKRKGSKVKPEVAQQIKETMRSLNMVWWSNGESETLATSCPGSGWSKGKLFRFWWNDGNKNLRSPARPGPGFVRGRLIDDNLRSIVSKAGERVAGKRWFNNGTSHTLAFECPEGWTSGMLKNKSK